MAEIAKTNRQLILKKRPAAGPLTLDNFEVREAPQYEVGPGQILVKVTHLSMDPTLRIWATDEPQYMPPVQLGEVMRSIGLGTVVKSENPGFAVGDVVTSMVGWQEYALLDAKTGFLNKVPPGTPPEVILGPCGVTGLTAYAGLFELGSPKPGDLVRSFSLFFFFFFIERIFRKNSKF
jgi:NADPH-dependent curcumin reductase CurA